MCSRYWILQCSLLSLWCQQSMYKASDEWEKNVTDEIWDLGEQSDRKYEIISNRNYRRFLYSSIFGFSMESASAEGFSRHSRKIDGILIGKKTSNLLWFDHNKVSNYFPYQIFHFTFCAKTSQSLVWANLNLIMRNHIFMAFVTCQRHTRCREFKWENLISKLNENIFPPWHWLSRAFVLAHNSNLSR